MTLPLFSRVILTKDFPEHALLAGDTGTIVESHPTTNEVPAGYEVECFAANGETLAVISVFATDVRQPTSDEVTHVRPLVRSPVQPLMSPSMDSSSDANPNTATTIANMVPPQLTGRALTHTEYMHLVPDSLDGMIGGYLGSPDNSNERLSLLMALLVNEWLQRVVNLFPREQWKEALLHYTDQPLSGENRP